MAENKTMFWTGWVLTILPAAMLTLDGAMKIAKPPMVVKETMKVGYPESTITGMGIALLVSVALYLIPTTAVLGAILLTGYLGGAVATHVRVGDPVFTHILAPVYFGCVIWLALILRDAKLRSLLPIRTLQR